MIRISDDVKNTLLESASTIDGYEEVVRNKYSGFSIRKQPKEDMINLMDYLGTIVAENNNLPISTSEVVYYWLKINDGKLDRAVWDTALSLKLLARNDLETGAYLPNNDKVWEQRMYWYANTFIDEFSLGNSYTLLLNKYGEYQSDPNISARNMTGLGYHDYYKVALLQLLPVTVVQQLTVGEMLILNDGELKTISDVVPSYGLKATEQYLSSLNASK